MNKVLGSFRVVAKNGSTPRLTGLWFRITPALFTEYFKEPVGDRQVRLADWKMDNNFNWTLKFAIDGNEGTKLYRDNTGVEARIAPGDLSDHPKVCLLIKRALKLKKSTIPIEASDVKLVPGFNGSRLLTFNFNPNSLMGAQPPEQAVTSTQQTEVTNMLGAVLDALANKIATRVIEQLK